MAERRKQVIPKAGRRLERDVEKPVVAYARESHECLVRKMNGLGYRGWPDQMFISQYGHVFFIEFKRPGGGVLSAGQELVIDSLRLRGVHVDICDNVEVGKRIVDARVVGEEP